MSAIGEYWRGVALEWDESSYARRLRGQSLVEKLATLQRSHIRDRMATAERRLAPWIPGKSFVEIGCGGGELTLALLEAGAASGTGIDISAPVVEAASKRAADAGVADRATFLAADLVELPELSQPDIVIGLGILEYLEPALLEDVLKRLRPQQVFLSFHEKRPELQAALHVVYRNLKRMPYYKKYDRDELRALLKRAGYDVEIFREGANAFATSLSL